MQERILLLEEVDIADIRQYILDGFLDILPKNKTTFDIWKRTNDARYKVIQDVLRDVDNSLQTLESLNPFERELVYQYTIGLNRYINDAKKSDLLRFNNQFRTLYDIRYYFKNLFERLPTTTAPLTVWRGFPVDEFDFRHQVFEKGLGVLSTSLSVRTAIKFQRDSDCCLYRIHVEVGTPILCIMGLSNNPNEGEIILPASSGLLTINYEVPATRQLPKFYDTTFAVQRLGKRKRSLQWEEDEQSGKRHKRAIGRYDMDAALTY